MYVLIWCGVASFKSSPSFVTAPVYQSDTICVMSIATHPASTTHQRLPQAQKDALGITPGLVRLSCGIEDPQDLLADVLGALDAAGASQPGREAAE